MVAWAKARRLHSPWACRDCGRQSSAQQWYCKGCWKTPLCSQCFPLEGWYCWSCSMDFLADALKGIRIHDFQTNKAALEMRQMGKGARTANQKKIDSLLMNFGPRQYVCLLSLVFRVRGRLHSEAKPQISFWGKASGKKKWMPCNQSRRDKKKKQMRRRKH